MSNELAIQLAGFALTLLGIAVGFGMVWQQIKTNNQRLEKLEARLENHVTSERITPHDMLKECRSTFSDMNRSLGLIEGKLNSLMMRRTHPE